MPRIKFKPQNQVASDKSPLQFKVLPGVREKIKTVPDTEDIGFLVLLFPFLGRSDNGEAWKQEYQLQQVIH